MKTAVAHRIMPVSRADRNPFCAKLDGREIPEKLSEWRHTQQLGAGLNPVYPLRIEPVHNEPFDFRPRRNQFMKQPAERLLLTAHLPAQGALFGGVSAEAAELKCLSVLSVPGYGLLQLIRLDRFHLVQIELHTESSEK